MTNRLFDDSELRSQVDLKTAEATAKLRELLPELRKVPGFPEGSDEDILAMSFPPYYTACPNPFIEEWLGGLERPSGKGRVDPGPFASDISEGKGNPFYKAHSYPTKVPHPAIMRFILHYTKPGDVVLDGFCGTGMTGVAAQACGMPDEKTRLAIQNEMGVGNFEWGARRAILADLSPSASFISSGVNLPIDGVAFDKASKAILNDFDKNLGWMYETEIQYGTGKNKQTVKAKIDYTIWSEVFTCPHCGSEVVFYEAAFEDKSKTVRDEFLCNNPSCSVELTKNVLERRLEKFKTIAGDIIERIELRPIKIAWTYKDVSGEKLIDGNDLGVLEKISQLRSIGFPTNELPLKKMGHGSRLAPKGFSSVHHLWSNRSIIALAFLWTEVNKENDQLLRLALKFWIEQGFWGLSWMNRYKANDHSQVNRNQSGVYYISSLISECSIRYNLDSSKRKSLAKLWSLNTARIDNCYISVGSSTHLTIPDNSVDYIFIDPPFGQNIPYSDLALVTEYWHHVMTASMEEATEDPFKGRGLDEYADLITQCLKEFYRVLIPGRWMTIEFSNHSNDVWLRIQHGLAIAGFVVADTRVFDKGQLSYRQVTAENAVKHDLVISAYKPASGTERAFQIAQGAPDGAWAFVREHLGRIHHSEGEKGKALVLRERQADRIYERMVAYHVARNTLVPMTAAEFYSGLDQRFPLRDGMYFLPDQVEAYERFRITFKVLATQSLFIRDESSAVQWLRQQLKDKPRTFAEMQPIFLREMQAGIAAWEDLPDLKSMLDDNFILDDRGRWAVPDPKKSEHLDQIRIRALLKEFATYISGRGVLGKFRTEAIRAGFKDAWARKDFPTIVSVGRRLPSDIFIEDSSLLHYFRNAERLAG